ncbi:MAG: response regulator [Planctomycetota bacterium]
MPKILIAENKIEIRYKIRKLLEKEDFIVTEAENAEDMMNTLQDNSFDAVILDIMMGEPNSLDLCRKLTSAKTEDSPVLVVLCELSNIEVVEDIFRAGASSVITPPIKGDIIVKKLKDALGHTEEEEYKGLKPPKILKDIYTEIIDQGKTLGDVAEIVPGIATRDNVKYISEVRRSEKWLPILTQNDIFQFERNEHSRYVFYEPRMLLRSPGPDVISSVKVLVGRNAPPIRAYIDRDRMRSDISVYNIVPVDGLLPEYTACYLNSRIMDFFLRRIRPLKTSPEVGSVLRSIDLEAIPIIIPKTSIQDKIADLTLELERNNIAMRSKSKNLTCLAQIHKILFEIYGFSKEAIDKLSALSF